MPLLLSKEELLKTLAQARSWLLPPASNLPPRYSPASLSKASMFVYAPVSEALGFFYTIVDTL